ncbi:MAG: PatB family C-S lyase [Candidatus Accumulibacter sp.]|nr:PatB family C-S lyase [Accumulibacter sp.]
MTAPYDFDRVVDRSGGDSMKWNKYAGRDVLPMWVADMDFPAAPEILAAITRRVARGDLGYADPPASLAGAVRSHLAREYGWPIEADWLVWLPGLVTGINVACRAVGGGVFTATPVYPPFLTAPGFSGLPLASAPLCVSGNRWAWDIDAVEAAITLDTRLFLLCHPHNPVGRAWNADELLEVAALCERKKLFICSDEIHCGLVLDTDKRHVPFAALAPGVSDRCITLMAPSKTWNIPGMACAFAVIPDASLRRRFLRAMQGIVPHVNALGFAAAEAACREGGAWRAALLDALRANRDRVEETVKTIDGVAMTHVEASFLAWIDARGLPIDDPTAFFESHGLGLSCGRAFGAPGWVRLNFGCPMQTLETALSRMRRAVESLG